MLEYFQIFASLDHIIKHRKGEIKLGEKFKFLALNTLESLKKHQMSGVKFALIGIPECIGIWANHGTGGAENSWEQFLIQFANQQSNRFFDGSNILCLGQVQTQDLLERAGELNPEDGQYYTKLRSLCQELDQRVAPTIEQVGKAGLIPVIIGGGHNNSYPILKGMTRGLGSLQGINCINLDAHADFRPLEGRHSGNGFSYAYYQGFLQRYYVIGLHENANSEAMLKNMDLEAGVAYDLYKPGQAPDVSDAIKFVQEVSGPVGLEIDLDAISFMPASAYTVSGYHLYQALELISGITKQLKPVYIHFSEGQIKDQSGDRQIVGKALSAMVLDFLKSYPG